MGNVFIVIFLTLWSLDTSAAHTLIIVSLILALNVTDIPKRKACVCLSLFFVCMCALCLITAVRTEHDTICLLLRQKLRRRYEMFEAMQMAIIWELVACTHRDIYHVMKLSSHL